MNKLNAYYRAFLNYRKTTKDNNYCKSSRRTLINNQKEDTKLIASTFKVVVCEDWVSEIESKIIYIEKAVKEERQFIQTIGEVIPIEKAKKISRESVVHLARHSNFITKEPEEGKTLTPEKIYMTEKNNDYAVYENRFLYFVLCFLKEFVGQRYEAINKALTTYQGNLVINKDLKQKNGSLKFNLTLDEINTDNPYYNLSDEMKDIIERIDTIRFSIDMLLNTNLMIEVSKAPMIKLPIVKTNPIKMNNNFKITLELFEYVNSYSKDGYEIIEQKNEFNPLDGDLVDNFIEITELSSFLAYQYGTNITEILQREYEVEEDEIKEKEKQALAIKIKNLKHRIENEKISPYEYMLMLEEYNRKLENDSAELISVKNRLIEEEKENANLRNNIKNLNQIISDKDKEIERLNLKYEIDMEELKNNHIDEINNLTDDYENRINELNEDFSMTLQQRIEEQKEEDKVEIDNLNDRINSLNESINSLNDEKNEIIKLSKDNENSYLQEKSTLITNYEEEIKNLNQKYESLESEKLYTDSLNLTYKLRCNEKVDPKDFSKEDDFKNLEASKKAIEKLYMDSWKEAKKDIRNNHLWGKLKEYISEIKNKKNKDLSNESSNEVEENINEEDANEEVTIDTNNTDFSNEDTTSYESNNEEENISEEVTIDPNNTDSLNEDITSYESNNEEVTDDFTDDKSYLDNKDE